MNTASRQKYQQPQRDCFAGVPVDWGTVAASYDVGRPFPAASLASLVQSVPRLNALLAGGAHVVEVGAGTGRILLPLAQLYPQARFTAIDNSQRLLSVLRERVESERAKVEIVEHDVELPSSLPTADVYLCSSVLHTLRGWRHVAGRISRAVADGGCVVLLGEEADVYNLGLARSPENLPALERRSLLVDFWEHYHLLRAQVHAPPVEQTQIGCRWEARNEEAVEQLRQFGFSTVETSSVVWEKQLRASDLIQLIEGKVFSSIIALSDAQHSQVLSGLKQFVKQWDPGLTVPSRYLGVMRTLLRVD